MRTPYIIAEIGINHNGNIEIAKKLIDMAASCNCDSVKFQKRTIESVYNAKFLYSLRKSPWGTTQYEQKEGLEFEEEEYDEIDRYCKKLGIDWFASAWDIQSQKFLKSYNCKHNKIPSAMITNIPFLEFISKEKKHTFISTGMCTYDDIDKAVDIFRNNHCHFTLMHCISTYPCNDAELNLLCIKTLQEKYRCDVGYSGHEISPYPSIIAAALGAVAIERHITLDRSMYGSDQSASLEIRGLEILVKEAKSIPIYLGDGIKKFSKKEKSIAKKLRYFNRGIK